MATLQRVKQSLRSEESDAGADSDIIPADAGVEDVCDEEIETVEEILTDVRPEKRGVIPALQGVQDEYGYLPKFAFELIARHCEKSLADIYSTASFYSQFHLEPRGDYSVRVCTGTACHVAGADAVSEELQDELDVGLDEVTDDGQFTIEHVRCVGACGLAPVVTVDDDVHGPIEPEDAETIIEEYDDGGD